MKPSAVRSPFALAAFGLCAAATLLATGPGGSSARRQEAPARDATPSPDAAAARPLKAGEEAGGPWWMVQTALTPSGELPSLRNRKWWKKAYELPAGESFTVEASGDAEGRMVVRKDPPDPASPRPAERLVWILDDDGDGSAASGGDRDSDCYVYDEECDGLVDRVVDYVDADGDQTADAMEVRAFVDGVLRWAWFGDDLDGDGVLRDPGAGGEGGFDVDAAGDGRVYTQKFDPERGAWVPAGECPSAFFDANGDGFCEEAVRVTVAPQGHDPAKDPDGALAAAGRPWERAMAEPEEIAILDSFDVDRGAGPDAPYHYDMSFLASVKAPYPRDAASLLLRRPPQETTAIPWAVARDAARSAAALAAGFSWQEAFDDTVALGRPGRPDDDLRWEGLPWIWERRFLDGVGAACQKWNVRREWRGTPSAARELYYSGVDQRIHLLGASEGWVQVGNFGGLGALGEIRMSDTDGNGYFDRWEIYRPNSARPVRVSQVRDEKARRLPFEGVDALADFYLREVLPAAQARNEKLLAALRALRPTDLPAGFEAATKVGSEGQRRYACDVLRELTYQGVRDFYAAEANQVLLRDDPGAGGASYTGDLRPAAKTRVRNYVSSVDSRSAWTLVRLLENLDIAYGNGDDDRVVAILGEIGKLPNLR